jgi:hypothetical protein
MLIGLAKYVKQTQKKLKMPFEINNTFGAGRPKNSKNKLPDRIQICNLIDIIISDFQDQYSSLTIAEKIKILDVFKNLYSPQFYQVEQMPDNEIKVTIINAKPNE